MKFFSLLFLFTTLAVSDMIDGIALTIDDEPVTLYEIHQEQALNNLPIKESVNTLIRKKLETLEARERGIIVSNQEVIDDLRNLARQNNLTLERLYEAMNSTQQLTESQVKEKTKEKLLKQKLYNAIAMSQIDQPDDSEIQEYYNLHAKDFSLPTSIDVTVYAANNKHQLAQIMANPMLSLDGTTIEDQSIELAKINPRLAELLVKTEEHTFSPILPRGQNQGYMSFYINSKGQSSAPSLEIVRGQIENMIMQERKEKILKEHFDRKRLNVEIKIIRLPEEN